jgi:hypothetical protein
MPNVEIVWNRILAHGGELFHTVSGIPFTYSSGRHYIRLNNTQRNIPKADFARAVSRIPLGGMAKAQRLGVQGPAYLYAIVMDHRIRQND